MDNCSVMTTICTLAMMSKAASERPSCSSCSACVLCSSALAAFMIQSASSCLFSVSRLLSCLPAPASAKLGNSPWSAAKHDSRVVCSHRISASRSCSTTTAAGHATCSCCNAEVLVSNSAATAEVCAGMHARWTGHCCPAGELLADSASLPCDARGDPEVDGCTATLNSGSDSSSDLAGKEAGLPVAYRRSSSKTLPASTKTASKQERPSACHTLP